MVEMAPEHRDVQKSALVIGDLHANDPQPGVQRSTSAIVTQKAAQERATRRHEDRIKLICVVGWTFCQTLSSVSRASEFRIHRQLNQILVQIKNHLTTCCYETR